MKSGNVHVKIDGICSGKEIVARLRGRKKHRARQIIRVNCERVVAKRNERARFRVHNR